MLILNSVLPVFGIIALGSVLHHYKFTSDQFLRTSDKLIYFIFFPVMLFWKIGAPAPGTIVDWAALWAVLTAVFLTFLAGLLYVKLASVPRGQVGSFIQCCFRFNSYVGMAVILNVMGEEGVRQFSVMISIIIPFINLLCVSTLIWNSDREYSGREKYIVTLKAIASNPLILACVLGILYAQLHTPFPVFLRNTFQLLSYVALPMALISIGGALTLSKVKNHFSASLAASVLKLLVLPLIGYGLLRLFGVTGVSLEVTMIFFMLPTSTAAYVLSSQLGSDLDLASAAIVLSTLLSFVSLSAAMQIFLS